MSTENFSNAAAASVLRRSSRLLAVSVGNVEATLATQQYASINTRKPLKRKKDVNVSPAEVESTPPKTKRRRATSKKTGTDITDSQDYMENPQRSKRKSQPKPEPVYDIPDVEKRETSFRGRLGYACLNTVLRNKKPASDSIFSSRTCRIDSIKKNGMDWVKELGQKNVEDLLTIIQWNEDNNIRFFRLSSEMFPFASHEKYGYNLDYCAPFLARAGALAIKYGHRLTTHPGQYTQLGSPKPAVVVASRRELAYHCQMLDLMGMGPDSVMIVHGGGVYNDKAATLERLKDSIISLPKNIRDRLVLENDEMCYNAEDLLPICEELDVPLVFDYHHDVLYPSSISPKEIIERASAIWERRGIKPKQHLSEPRPGAVTLMERRAHSDRCENLPPDLPDDMDLMIEVWNLQNFVLDSKRLIIRQAKDKEQAVLYLHRRYDLQPVIYASLRPPNPCPSTATKGRKSARSTRLSSAKETLEGQSLQEPDTASSLGSGDSVVQEDD